MSEMIERIAEAIRRESDRLEYTGFLSTAVSEALARVALEAMREPTDDMVLHRSYIDGEWSRRTWEASMRAALRISDERPKD